MIGGPTPLQQARWDAYEAAGGDGSIGAQSRAARALGISAGALASSVAGYRTRTSTEGHVAKPHRVPRPTELMREIPVRLEAIEKRMESLLADQAASAVLLSKLAHEIRAWTNRQPVLLEVRPRHQRQADGGEGGNREGKSVRLVET